MERSKIAVIFALVIIACVLALIVIIPYVCFLINFWLGLIVSIVFVSGISYLVILISDCIKKNQADKEIIKINEEYRKVVEDNLTHLKKQRIEMWKRNNQ
ncbi:hypothetical protein [Bacteroides clarus]|uniref:hypothetical protein n=1 Tax=Bacteroides clarus TaxID=626929 RepID=UPI0011DE13E7|nr:hypothetical protein [Bacteroides clarus]